MNMHCSKNAIIHSVNTAQNFNFTVKLGVDFAEETPKEPHCSALKTQIMSHKFQAARNGHMATRKHLGSRKVFFDKVRDSGCQQGASHHVHMNDQIKLCAPGLWEDLHQKCTCWHTSPCPFVNTTKKYCTDGSFPQFPMLS